VRIRNLSVLAAVALFLFVVGLFFLLRRLKKTNQLNAAQNLALADLNHSKDKLMSLLAHDLRSPFQILTGLSQQAREQVTEGEWEDARHSLSIINQSSQEAYYLFESLLGWAKSQTGKLKFSPEKLDLVSLINENLQVVEAAAKARNVKVLTPRGSFPAWGDPFMVSTLIRNLLSNAVKFTRLDSEVKVSVHEHKGQWIISVKDQGPGLSPAIIKQLTEGNITPGSGNGLGLILCRDFAEMHGQKLEIKSSPGTGANFAFAVPQCFAQNAAACNTESVRTESKQESKSQSSLLPDNSISRELGKVKIYQSSRLKKLLAELDTSQSKELQNWKERLLRAAEQFNEPAFQHLLQQVRN